MSHLKVLKVKTVTLGLPLRFFLPHGKRSKYGSLVLFCWFLQVVQAKPISKWARVLPARWGPGLS